MEDLFTIGHRASGIGVRLALWLREEADGCHPVSNGLLCPGHRRIGTYAGPAVSKLRDGMEE